MIDLRPVRDPKTGEIQLYDMFVGGIWWGSRSTVAQCLEAVGW